MGSDKVVRCGWIEAQRPRVRPELEGFPSPAEDSLEEGAATAARAAGGRARMSVTLTEGR